MERARHGNYDLQALLFNALQSSVFLLRYDETWNGIESFALLVLSILLFSFFFFVFHPRYSFKIPERIKILWTLTIWWIVAQVSCHLDIRVVSSLSWKMNFFPSGTLNRSMLDAFVKHSFIRTLIPKYDRTQRFLESDDSSRTTQIRGVGRGNWTRLEYEKICNSRKESS